MHLWAWAQTMGIGHLQLSKYALDPLWTHLLYHKSKFFFCFLTVHYRYRHSCTYKIWTRRLSKKWILRFLNKSRKIREPEVPLKGTNRDMLSFLHDYTIQLPASAACHVGATATVRTTFSRLLFMDPWCSQLVRLLSEHLNPRPLCSIKPHIS